MKKSMTLIITALGLVGLASACTVDAVEGPSAEDFGSADEAACKNEDGVNASMAALATATAKQLRRWKPQTDFAVNATTRRLELTTAGKARCTADGGQCKNVQAILDFQKPEANGVVKFPGGDVLNSNAFRDRLRSSHEAQIVCNNRPDNHIADNCPTEEHDLTFSGTALGACETDFFFHATKAGSTALLQYPAQLKNQLIWVGYATGSGGNPYLQFDMQGDDARIDPTGGPVEGDPASGGTCAAVCSKFSTTNITGQCCACNSVQRTFAVSAFNTNYYLCK